MIGGVFPVVLIILIVATFVAIAVACTSQCHKPPRYHCVRENSFALFLLFLIHLQYNTALHKYILP